MSERKFTYLLTLLTDTSGWFSNSFSWCWFATITKGPVVGDWMLCSTIILYSVVFWGKFSFISLVFVFFTSKFMTNLVTHFSLFPNFSRSWFLLAPYLQLNKSQNNLSSFVSFYVHNSNKNRLQLRMYTFIMLEILKLFRIFNSNLRPVIKCSNCGFNII